MNDTTAAMVASVGVDQPPSTGTSYIGLAEAARHAPGRPSVSCIWRWARRGVRSRDGERVRLQHVRAGGKIFTTVRWIEEFGARLAAADAAYFQAKEASPPLRESLSPSQARSKRQTRLKQPEAEEQRRAEVRIALERAGL